MFFLPGLGRLIFQGITQRDLIVVKSVVMLLVCAVIVVNFLVDLSYLAGRSAAEAALMTDIAATADGGRAEAWRAALALAELRRRRAA